MKRKHPNQQAGFDKADLHREVVAFGCLREAVIIPKRLQKVLEALPVFRSENW